MSLPDDLKGDLHRTLLGPLSLADDLFGALLPGCLFSLILLWKGNASITRALAYPYFGYKTRIICGILVSYLIGKVALCTVGFYSGFDKDDYKRHQGKWYSSPAFITFLGGVAAGPLMAGKSRTFEYYMAHVTQVNATLSLGLLLLVAAFIPGDGQLRIAEAAAGLVFLTSGVLSHRKTGHFTAGIIGTGIGERLASFSNEQLLNTGVAIAKAIGEASPHIVAAMRSVSTQSSEQETPSTSPGNGVPSSPVAGPSSQPS